MGGDEAALRVQVLGPVRAWRGRRELSLGPPQQRSVLAVLALAAGRVVSRIELIDAVWDTPSDRADAALYAYISRLRGVLEPGRDARVPWQLLISSGSGYQLRIEPGQVDVTLFGDQVSAARQARDTGELTVAAQRLAAALRLWQGSALAGLDGPWVRSERLRLEDARLSAVEEHAELELALGHHAEVASDLPAWMSRHPLREGLACLLMLALYRDRRQADALAVFHDTRQLLAAELGIEPGPGLRRLHERILAADQTLDSPCPDRMAAVAQSAAVPHELPGDVAGFTGRTAELAALDALLPSAASPATGTASGTATGPVVISAVSGTAGVGKTALAVHWAHRVTDAFPDGQLYVNLRGYDLDQPVPAGEALAGFLRALGVPDQAVPLREAERAARFRSEVTGKRLLVVLDNAATVAQVRSLLPGSPSVLVVVTSRDALAGLVARDGARRLDLDLLPAADAVELLRILIGDRVDADPVAAGTLAVQCARLPLALRVAAELAVARPDAPLAELAGELAGLPGRVQLLDAAGDMRSGVATVFSWSYLHLGPGAAHTFRLLGLHPGTDWDRDAVAALTAASAPEAGQRLAELARAHLIEPAGPRRYGMHDLLRGYAASLSASQDRAQVRRAALTRLFDYYLATCAAAMDVFAPTQRGHRPGLPLSSTQARQFSDRAAAQAWLDAELATLIAVAAHTAACGWPGHTTGLAGTLFFYLEGDHSIEAFTIHSHALAAARVSGDHAAEALALANLGNLHGHQGHNEEALGYTQQALRIARKVGDRDILRRVLMRLGVIHYRQCRYRRTADCYRQSLALHRELGDQLYEAQTLTNLGGVDFRLGRYRQAGRHHQRALTLFRQLGHQQGEAHALINLGEVYYRQDDYQQAADCERLALAMSAQSGNKYTEATALATLGEICSRQGSYDQAATSHERALALFQEISDPAGQAATLNGAGATLLATGHPGQAHDRYAAALALTIEVGDRYEQARALIGLGEACHRQGDPGQARDHHQQALALCRDIGARGEEAAALNGLAQALLATGQPSLSHASHTAALTLSGKTGDRYQQAHAHQGLAACCAALGQADQARQHRQLAMAIYTGLGVPEASQALAKDPAPGGPIS